MVVSVETLWKNFTGPLSTVTTASTRPSLSISPNATPRWAAACGKSGPAAALTSWNLPLPRLRKTEFGSGYLRFGTSELCCPARSTRDEEVFPAVVVEIEDAVAPPGHVGGAGFHSAALVGKLAAPRC